METRGRPAQEIRLTLRKNVGVYYARLKGWTNYRSTGASRRAEANQIALEWLMVERQGGQVPPPAVPKKKIPATTFGEFAQEMFKPNSTYEREQAAKGKAQGATHLVNLRAYLKNYALPNFGSRPLASIQAKELNTYLLGLDRANETKNHILSFFSIVLQYGVQLGLLTKNPALDVGRFSSNWKRRDTLTKAEYQNLFPLHDVQRTIAMWGDIKWAAFMSVLATTGMRLSEVRALVWKDLQRKDGAWYIPVEKAAKADGEIGRTKTAKSGVALLLAEVKSLLDMWKECTPFSTEPDSLIFTARDGRILNPRTALEVFGRGLRNAKVVVEGRNLVLHGLRHAFVSLLDDAGADRETIVSSTNHTDERTIERYTHRDSRVKQKRLKDNQERIRAGLGIGTSDSLE